MAITVKELREIIKKMEAETDTLDRELGSRNRLIEEMTASRDSLLEERTMLLKAMQNKDEVIRNLESSVKAANEKYDIEYANHEETRRKFSAARARHAQDMQETINKLSAQIQAMGDKP